MWVGRLATRFVSVLATYSGRRFQNLLLLLVSVLLRLNKNVLCRYYAGTMGFSSCSLEKRFVLWQWRLLVPDESGIYSAQLTEKPSQPNHLLHPDIAYLNRSYLSEWSQPLYLYLFHPWMSRRTPRPDPRNLLTMSLTCFRFLAQTWYYPYHNSLFTKPLDRPTITL